MRLNIKNSFNWKFLEKLITAFKSISLYQTCYISLSIFYNIDQISFDINLEKNGINLFLSFLFCILSIFLTLTHGNT